jgi:PST family polysaccharide transporter
MASQPVEEGSPAPSGEPRRRGSAIAGFRWVSSARMTLQLVRLGVQVVLARILAPADFGMMAVAFVVLRLFDVIQDLGTGRAIIVRPELNRELFDSVFVINLSLGLAMALVLALGAPLIAAMYGHGGDAALPSMLRWLALSVAISCAGNAQRGVLVRWMSFGQLAMSDVVTAVVNGVVAISLAWAGFGVWAMVAGHMTGVCISTAMLWFWSPWWPRLRIRGEDWQEIRNFSLNLTAANIAGFLLRNTDSFLVTRFLGADAMGFFSMGERLIRPTRVAAQTFMSVLNPALARAYDDDARLRRDLLRAAGGVCFVLHPVLVGLFLTADLLVPVVLGPRWSGAIVVAQAMVFSAFAVRTVQVPHALFFAKSRTDLILRYTLLQGAALFVAGAIGVQFGLAVAVWALAGAYALLVYPGLTLSLGLIGMRPWELLREDLGYLLLCVPMALAVIGARVLLEPLHVAPPLELAALVALGAVVHAAAVWIVRPAALEDVRKVVPLGRTKAA